MERSTMTDKEMTWRVWMAFLCGLLTVATIGTFCLIVWCTNSPEHIGGVPLLLFFHTVFAVIATITGYETITRM